MIRTYSLWVVAALLWLPGSRQAIEAQDTGGDPAVAQGMCATCHLDKFDSLVESPHGVLQREDWLSRLETGPACVACHGDPTAHIQAGGGRGSIFAFREESAGRQTALCLSCHNDDHARFAGSLHADAGLGCTSCHQAHHLGPAPSGLLKSLAPTQATLGNSPVSSLCLYCHADISAQFAFTARHRLEEGVLDCNSCHDPHGLRDRPLFGGPEQSRCVSCHSEKSGPFVFEHASLLVEGCTACHTPHGSPNRHLLSHQQVGEVCLSCHAAVPQFHLGFNPTAPSRFGLDTQCTNCHSAIHGSNFDPFFLR